LASPFDDVGEQCLRIRIGRVVGRRHRRDADAGAAFADFLGDRIDDLEQEAGAVFDRAAIFIGADIEPERRNWSIR
jgi:hypothetical protein